MAFICLWKLDHMRGSTNLKETVDSCCSHLELTSPLLLALILGSFRGTHNSEDLSWMLPTWKNPPLEVSEVARVSTHPSPGSSQWMLCLSTAFLYSRSMFISPSHSDEYVINMWPRPSLAPTPLTLAMEKVIT